jgi:RNA polymerase sigma-70 factor (ECF subfamily)
VAALFERHANTVYRYCRVRLGPTAAQDAVSEVFVTAWRRHADIPEAELAWLLGVARRVVAHQLRGADRAAGLAGRIGAHTASFFPDHADTVADSDLARRALARLAPRDRDVIVLLMARDLTPAELGTALECSAGSAAVRAHRARRRLADAWRAEDRGDPLPRRLAIPAPTSPTTAQGGFP